MNNKIYIGQSQNIKKRIAIHKQHLRGDYHTNSYLQNAWNKTKEENFRFETLLYMYIGPQLNDIETKLIEMVMRRNQAYNLAKDATAPMRGRKHTKEAKHKISIGLRENKHRLGIPHTEETKRKIGMAGIGRKQSDETKQKRVNSRLGYRHSAETKRKISIAAKARWSHA